MGGKCPHRKVKTRRCSHKQFRRMKFEAKGDDAVYDQLQKPESQIKPLPLDEDLPGMGQYYCLHCDRYFQNVSVRDDHFKTKKHRKSQYVLTWMENHQCQYKTITATCQLCGNNDSLLVFPFQSFHPSVST